MLQLTFQKQWSEVAGKKEEENLRLWNPLEIRALNFLPSAKFGIMMKTEISFFGFYDLNFRLRFAWELKMQIEAAKEEEKKMKSLLLIWIRLLQLCSSSLSTASSQPEQL